MDRERLAHYRIISRLGAGGMGEVYRARDEQLDRDVAVKVLPASSFDDPTARARLVREARAAAALNHPNICTVHEVGEADGSAVHRDGAGRGTDARARCCTPAHCRPSRSCTTGGSWPTRSPTPTSAASSIAT